MQIIRQHPYQLLPVLLGGFIHVISKTLVGFVGGALMVMAYLVGAFLGGAIAGSSFDTGVAGVGGIVMCLLSKVLLMAVFAPIYLLMGVVGKQKIWFSMVGSFCIGMLFFMMIPMLTPLDSGAMNVILCLVGGGSFSIGLGAVSNLILKKQVWYDPLPHSYFRQCGADFFKKV